MIAFTILLQRMSCREKHMQWQPEVEPDPMHLEDFPQTKQGGIDLVKAIFQLWGGTIAPPHRPGKGEFRLDIYKDSFYMDFENACLQHHWDSSVTPHPKGPKRFENKAWAEMIQNQVYPHHSDVDWWEYKTWVENGGGDDWFQAEINE